MSNQERVNMASTVNARSGEVDTTEIKQFREELEARCRKLRTYEIATSYLGMDGIQIDGVTKPKRILDETDAFIGNVLAGLKKAGFPIKK